MPDSLKIAFSTYSRIPVPQAEWSEEGMKYSMCYFPVVGAAVGAAEILLFLICEALHFGPAFRGCLLAALPVLLTGGIHFDGFLDTSDAIHSWKGREEKLRIMKDPHTGAFAVTSAVVYMVLMAGICSELSPSVMPVVLMIFVYSRALSGIAALTLPKARPDGMLRTMTDASPKAAAGILCMESILFLILILLAGTAGIPAAGAAAGVSVSALRGFFTALAVIAAGILMFGIYHVFVIWNFGGTTGDLAGWFLQMAEILMLAAAVLAMAGVG